jgi:hypothetical protein
MINLTVKQPTAGLSKIKDYLGDSYEIRTIDGEFVIYRDLGEGHDIEVSGLDHDGKTIKAIVYVWRKKPGLEIMEIYEKIHNLIDLKDLLGFISTAYRNSDPEKPLYVKSR